MRVKLVRVARALLTISLIASIALPAAATTHGKYPNYPNSPSEGKKKRDLGDALPWLILGGALIAGINHARAQRLPEPPDAATLLERGPQLAPHYAMGATLVHAFVRGGWPVVVDYAPQPGSQVSLIVAVKGKRKFVHPLDTASPERQMTVLHLPDYFGAQPTPATILVQAVRSSTANERNPLAPRFKRAPVEELAPLRLYALGMGPATVGSTKVDALAFGPEVVHATKGESAAFSARSVSHVPLGKVSFEVLRTNVAREQIEVEMIKSHQALEHVEPGPIPRSGPGRWDGTDEARKISYGAHLLQVRAWRNQSDADWIASWSDDQVHVVR